MRALLAVLLLAVSCTKPPAPPTPMETNNRQPVDSAQGGLSAANPSGPRIVFPDGFVVRVEIAADSDSRAQGLMYRDHIDPDKGMLFVFPVDSTFSFWMKNTRIPLDMIWIDANRRVVGVIENAQPCRVEDCPTYGPGVVARYVLEIGGGEAAKHELEVGDALQFIDAEAEAR